MKTKVQKNQSVKETENLLKENKNVTFVDFSGISDGDMKVLRKNLLEIGAKTKVIKKKLLRVAFEKNKIDFNPEQFDSQLASIFSVVNMTDVASPVYKFFKEKEKSGFKILGAYDLEEKNFMDADMVKMIGQLPSREVLLAQLMGLFTAPVKMFMYVLDQKSKQTT